MKWPVEKKIAGGFGLLLTILIIIGVNSFQSALKFIETTRLETKARVILKKLEIVLTEITDTETGQRGYIITGDERYLGPYHAAVAEIDRELKELRRMLKDSPKQLQRLDTLEPFIAEKLDGLEERIDLRKNRGFEAASQEVRSGKGRLAMDKIRKIINEIENEERELLKQGMEEAGASAERSIFVIIFGSSLAFLIVGIASFISNRELIVRKKAEKALQKAYDEMEQRVEDCTAELLRKTELSKLEVTDRKKVEEALLTSAQEWRATFDAVKEGIALVDLEQRILRCNNSLAHIIGRSFSEINGRTFSEFLHGALEPINSSFLRMLESHRREAIILQKENRWFNVTVDPTLNETGNLIGGVCIISDITELKRAEEKLHSYQEQLRSLTSQLSLIEERERHRIATEIHDNIGQTLAFCKIKLGALRESVPNSLVEYVDEIRDHIEETIQYTRSLTFEISSPILYELGFEAAVEWLTEQILNRYGIMSHFEDDGQSKPLNDEARVLLFQTVRELLVNVTKHAQALNAKVSIQRDDDKILINVEDDGVGFNTTEIDSYLGTSSFGLFSIRERLRHLGGHLEIKSKPGHGTWVAIVVPLKLEK